MPESCMEPYSNEISVIPDHEAADLCYHGEGTREYVLLPSGMWEGGIV
jgi:hypothetical protein